MMIVCLETSQNINFDYEFCHSVYLEATYTIYIKDINVFRTPCKHTHKNEQKIFLILVIDPLGGNGGGSRDQPPPLEKTF